MSTSPTSKTEDYKNDPGAIWAHYAQRIVDFLPESEKPNVPEIVNEHREIVGEAAKCNGEFKGCRIPAPFSAKLGKLMYENWMPESGDVLIACCPKSGTTWMHAIVTSLLYKGNKEMENIASKLSILFMQLEGFLPSLYEVFKKLPLKNRVYVTHMLPECVNTELLKKKGCKIIYVLRNPKDQTNSWYEFRLTLPLYDQGKMKELHPDDWNEFFEKYHTGQQWLWNREGEWYPHHMLAWYPYRNEKHVKFVYYEDVKKSPFKMIQEIANFLELDRSDNEIAEIVEKTSFQSMHEQLKGVIAFTRKGVVGDWKNRFTVAQSELMDQKVKEVLKETDISFTYE